MRAYAEQKLAKVEPLFGPISDSQLEVRTIKQKTGDISVVQITLRSGRRILRAEERATEPSKALDKALDKLTRQARKSHDRMTNKNRRTPTSEAVDRLAAMPDLRAAAPVVVDGEEPIDEEDEERDLAEVVRTKRFSVKPMTVDEAIDQMELLGHDFFLFHNADEDQLNVRYRRREGTYGLLAPSRT
jgi:putative sigma-54 modulation protein